MIGLGAAVMLLSALPACEAGIELRASVAGDDSVMVSRVRADPDEARQQLLRAIRGLPLAAALARRTVPDSIARSARAFAEVWSDGFPLAVLERYLCWPADRWSLKLRADSLRLAGNTEYAERGPAAAIRVWRKSAAVADRAGDTAGVASAFGNIGAAFAAMARPDSALPHLQRSRALASAQGDRLTEANAIGAMAGVARGEGDLARARSLYEEATVLRRGIGDTRGMAADLNNLGLVAEALGDATGAAELYRQALALNGRAGRDGPRASNLLNLGNLASATGDYAEAARLYREARQIREQRGEPFELAVVLYNEGLLADRRGDYPGAIALLSEAASRYRESGSGVDVVRARLALAGALRTSGRPQEAIDQLRDAGREARGTPLPASLEGELALSNAELSLLLNDDPSAERDYTRALARFRSAGDRQGQAAAEEGLGWWYLHRDQASRSVPRLERALVLRRALGDPRSTALSAMLLGYAYQHVGATDRARRQYAAALSGLGPLDDSVAEAAVLESAASLEYEAGRTAAAESLYARGIRRLGRRSVPEIAWRLHLGLGKVRERSGDSGGAGEAYRAAIGQIERESNSLLLPERRVGSRADKWEAYGRLATLELDRGRPDSVFALSEAMRARQLLDQLALGRVRAPKLPEELSDREQDLRRRIAELQLPDSDDDAPRTRGAAETARRAAELETLQAAYARTLLEIRELSPEYGHLIVGDVLDRASVARRLAPGDLVLEYLVLDSTSTLVAVTRDTTAAFDLGLTRRNLSDLVQFARLMVRRPSEGNADRSWQAPLRRLYQDLMAPVEQSGLLARAHHLIIVPHAELHYLPFGALLGGEGSESFLVERFAITYAPSATLWLRLTDRHRGALRSALALAPDPGRLPGSRAEVGAIRALYGADATVRTGAEASETFLRRDAGSADILHLAGFGVLNRRNPLFSYVQLASDSLDDGRLEVHEAYGLNVRGLVVLSACETALATGAGSDVPPGDDWVGLVQAFLAAGASAVVATHWRIDDRTTAGLMRQFYARLRGGAPPAQALADAQRATLRDPSTAHPFYWAGFSLSGASSP